MIVGASGCGKARCQAIAGLWRSGHGRIGCPASATCCFCPAPVHAAGRPAQPAALPPAGDQAIPDAELLAVLEQVNLPDLVARFGGLDAAQDWG